MTEADAVARSTTPITVETLVADFKALGIEPGNIVLVHGAMSAIGWVCGAQVAVLAALMGVLTEAGTLVMPTHSSHFSDPANWQNPPVPPHWWDTIRATMPAYDPAVTPTRGMGVIPEMFRTMAGVWRSQHPTGSFAAWGRHAEEIVQHHALSDPFGEDSPLARLYDLAGNVLLLGVGHGNNTSLHLAERRAFGERQARIQTGAPMLRPTGRQWVSYSEPDVDDSDFELLGADFAAASKSLVTGTVGLAPALHMAQRELVDFGVAWLRDHRGPSGKVISSK